MAQASITPLGAVVRGAVAGLAGTGAMDLFLWEQYRRQGGGDSFAAWWSSAGVEGYAGAPAPAEVGRRVVAGYLQRELGDGTARAMNNVVHLLTGIQWGVLHGLLAGTSGRDGPTSGVRTGLTAWLASYALLTPAGLYEPIWSYPPAVLAQDAGGHLVYGLTTAATFRLLRRSAGAG